MSPRYEDPSEYGGGDGPNYSTPDGTPRRLSSGERAGLMRRAGMRPTEPEPPKYGRPGTYEPIEYGVKLRD